MSDERTTRQLTTWSRRGWLSAAGVGLVGSTVNGKAEPVRGEPALQRGARNQSPPLPLAEFEPKSMLHVPETHIARARFPVIDFHTHISRRRGEKPAVPPAELLKAMDAVNLRTMVNLTGGSGEELV